MTRAELEELRAEVRVVGPVGASAKDALLGLTEPAQRPWAGSVKWSCAALEQHQGWGQDEQLQP